MERPTARAVSHSPGSASVSEACAAASSAAVTGFSPRIPFASLMNSPSASRVLSVWTGAPPR